MTSKCIQRTRGHAVSSLSASTVISELLHTFILTHPLTDERMEALNSPYPLPCYNLHTDTQTCTETDCSVFSFVLCTCHLWHKAISPGINKLLWISTTLLSCVKAANEVLHIDILEFSSYNDFLFSVLILLSVKTALAQFHKSFKHNS